MGLTDAELFCNLGLWASVFSDLPNLFVSQDCVPVAFPTNKMIASLRELVSRVVTACSEEQMVRIDTFFVVTPMQDAPSMIVCPVVWDFSLEEDV